MKRIPELDGIRGLAAIGIVCFHAFPYTFYFGWSCVDLFFVLSGYLITSIIMNEQGHEGFLYSFYLRRVSRIWPVYYLTLIFVLIANYFSRVGYPTSGLGWHLVFLQNTPAYLGHPVPPFIGTFGPSWSVAIEEQFYVVWPLVLLGLRQSRLPVLTAVLLFACVFGRAIWPDAIGLLITRGDGLAFGCFLGWLLKQRTTMISPCLVNWILGISGVTGAVYVGIYLVAFCGDPDPGWKQSCFTGFGLLYFSIIGTCVVCSGTKWLRLLKFPLLRWFGTISYALYLFHLPVFHYAPPIFERLGFDFLGLQILGTWTLIVLLPALSWYCLERPILRLQNRTRMHESAKQLVDVLFGRPVTNNGA